MPLIAVEGAREQSEAGGREAEATERGGGSAGGQRGGEEEGARRGGEEEAAGGEAAAGDGEAAAPEGGAERPGTAGSTAVWYPRQQLLMCLSPCI